MLILSRKCTDQVRLPEENITLNVIEIIGQRVCLGMEPPAGQPFDLREEDTTAPEVQLTERGYQVLVWGGPGAGIRINERVQVRVVAIDPDSVRLGIVVPPGKARSDSSPSTPTRPDTGESVSTKPTAVSQEVLAFWIADKIAAFLKDRPRGAVGELARAVGVSPATINRWRKRETNVASENLSELLRVLGVTREDLAAELGLKEFDLPEVRARGPVAR